MTRYLNNLLFLIIASTLSSGSWSAGLFKSKYDGMQLAWVRLPSSNTEEAPAVVSEPEAKPKSKPQSKPPKQTVKPKAGKTVTPSAIVPVPAAVVVTPKTGIKPEAVPVAAPRVHPAVVKPVHVEKPAPAYVRKEALTFEWLVGMGLDMGGEELGTVTYADGSTAPVNANTGIVLNVGGVLRDGKNNPFSTQLSIGYKSGGPKLWNKDVNWTAIQLEAVENYRISSMRAGLGISYYLNPQLKVDLPSSSSVSKYNNALGFIVQVGWMPVSEHYSIDLRYTLVKFQSSDVPDAATINGSVSGLYATYYY